MFVGTFCRHRRANRTAPRRHGRTPSRHHYKLSGGNRIFKLNLEGKILGVFGKPGKPVGEMAGVHHLAVSPSGDVYTAELAGWRAQRFVPQR